MQKVLVTGAAGFIGFHVAARLLAEGWQVVGLDNLNDYYDVTLKKARLAQLEQHSHFQFVGVDLADRVVMEQFFCKQCFDVVIHLAAQAGVRYSSQNPYAYGSSNLIGFLNILEGCRQQRVGHLVYASSSSVYGANQKLPFSTHDSVDHPLSLYAATKKANELMAHSYAAMYGLPTTGLRFFTVYGPWGRPDMALFKFTKAILAGEQIEVYNHGAMQRDFTYIDDVVEGVVRVAVHPPIPDAAWRAVEPNPGSSFAPWRVYNIGNHTPVTLLQYIEVLEACLGKKAFIRFLPMQPGEVVVTCADVNDLMRDVGFSPATPIEVGIKKFVDWYRGYYEK